jgi:homoserine acetyltransferase
MANKSATAQGGGYQFVTRLVKWRHKDAFNASKIAAVHADLSEKGGQFVSESTAHMNGMFFSSFVTVITYRKPIT